MLIEAFNSDAHHTSSNGLSSRVIINEHVIGVGTGGAMGAMAPTTGAIKL